MTTTFALLPLLLVLGLLASGRVGALIAGLAGLAATFAVSAVLHLAGRRPGVRGRAVAARSPGGDLARLAGHRDHRLGHVLPSLHARAPTAAGSETHPATPRRLWSVCFLLAPFAEAVTGFGVGYIIALAALRRLGLGGVPVLVLGLYSQSLVPWGALATGTTVGATLAGLTPNALGLGSSLLQVPIHVCYLLLYWRFARQAGMPVPATQKIDDVAWTALLLGADLARQPPHRRRDRRRGAAGGAARPALLARRAAGSCATCAPRSIAMRPMSRSPSRCARRGWCRRCATSCGRCGR